MLDYEIEIKWKPLDDSMAGAPVDLWMSDIVSQTFRTSSRNSLPKPLRCLSYQTAADSMSVSASGRRRISRLTIVA